MVTRCVQGRRVKTDVMATTVTASARADVVRIAARLSTRVRHDRVPTVALAKSYRTAATCAAVPLATRAAIVRMTSTNAARIRVMARDVSTRVQTSIAARVVLIAPG